MIEHKVDVSTATVASAAAASPVWLPQAQDAVAVAADPLWAMLLAPLGVLWLVIQIGYFLWDRYKKKKKETK